MPETCFSRLRSDDIVTPSRRTWSLMGPVPRSSDGPLLPRRAGPYLDPAHRSSVLSALSLSLFASILGNSICTGPYKSWDVFGFIFKAWKVVENKPGLWKQWKRVVENFVPEGTLWKHFGIVGFCFRVLFPVNPKKNLWWLRVWFIYRLDALPVPQPCQSTEGSCSNTHISFGKWNAVATFYGSSDYSIVGIALDWAAFTHYCV